MIFKRKVQKSKVFCVGLNKTGTTSLEKEMMDFGYSVGNQMDGTRLTNDWKKREFSRIIKLAKTADFFQDAPFSYPFTYVIMDHFFPKSKFILTIRDNSEQWTDSLTKFHSKLWGDGKNPLSKEELLNAPGIYPGFRYDVIKSLFDVTDDDLYNKRVLRNYYNQHNNNVKEYFRHRPNDLLILNISKPTAYIELCDFLNEKPRKTTFSWENKTADIKK
ncbi:sulfotransferase [Psychroflexus halocasei]|uniref:Sulfotransferase family protein n=1 Tax=Psychroflexus halocasei TaxID=908615 RepID=A0A1H4DCC5_9FLAO|nr:sulfotransferase [Psychroflexus halocasei]SEA69922.1 hypothetical protein SAMN05421540_11046 [Psychroflexus halocasei]